ncbi:MAG: hypothetical protein D6706_17460 [Chloroflexi bacterium]|nr:MAG: hypothetical protein D6706_17460 [Chloroflexota bacterium]
MNVLMVVYILIVSSTIWVVFRYRLFSVREVFSAFIAALVAMWLVTVFINSWLPRYILATAPTFTESWTAVWDEVNGKPYTTTNTDFDFIETLTGINTDNDTAEPAPAPQPPQSTQGVTQVQGVTQFPETDVVMPTPSADELETQRLIQEANAAIANGDELMVLAIAERLQSLSPAAAGALQNMVAAEKTRFERLQALGHIELKNGKDEATQVMVTQVLSGGTYRVIQIDRGLFRFACNEPATVAIVGGLYDGETFTVPSCYIENWATAPGDVFSVR